MTLPTIILLVLAAISLALWIVLIRFRGRFWRANQYLSAIAAPLVNPPEIVAIIPARNEEMTIGRAVTSLLEQDFGGAFSLIVVDDNSDDDTANAAKVAGQGKDNFTLIEGTKLPERWTGKMWAVAQGIETAKAEHPAATYYLLTDADILHHPENLSELVAKAQQDNLALVSLMVKLRCTSGWERLLIPAFIFFFQKLYPFPWVNDPAKKTAGAAGGCMLVECAALENMGGVAVIKEEIIDDCALAKRLKKKRGIWLGLTRSVSSLRGYDTLDEVWRMVCRTAFVQLDHSFLKLLGTLLGLMFIYAIPLLSMIIGFLTEEIEVLILGVSAWALMAVAYTPTLRLYGRPPWEACLLPLAALLYTGMTIDSAGRYYRGKPPLWKGRPNIKRNEK